MRLIRNTGSTVTAADDGRIIKNALGDGLFESVEFTISNGQINIPAFKGVLSGRDFTFDAQSLVPTLPTTSTPVTGQIIVRIDLSSETPLSLITVLDPYELASDDLNESGVVCEMRIGTYTASPSGVISVTSAVNNVINIAEKVNSGLTSINNLINTVAPIAAHNVTYARGNDGEGIYLQGGGTTIIGGGEAAQKIIDGNVGGAQAGMAENVHLAADDKIYFHTNCQTTRREVNIDTSGNLNLLAGGINAKGAIKSDGRTVFPITYKDVEFNAHTATWRASSGIYYAELAVTGWFWIYGVSYTGVWGGLPALIVPYIASTNTIGFMSTTNSFPSTAARVTVRIMGTRLEGD